MTTLSQVSRFFWFFDQITDETRFLSLAVSFNAGPSHAQFSSDKTTVSSSKLATFSLSVVSTLFLSLFFPALV